jgi:hypothetical protein
MKRIILSFAALIALTLPAQAGGRTIATVSYPAEDCTEILSQEYSTGGGKSGVHILEILCRDAEGTYTGHVATWGSLSGAFGFGRMGTIDKFIYKPVTSDTFSVKIHD